MDSEQRFQGGMSEEYMLIHLALPHPSTQQKAPADRPGLSCTPGATRTPAHGSGGRRSIR